MTDAVDTLISSRPEIRFVIFGEMHGTHEEPKLFGDIVESMTKIRRHTVVGLEFEDKVLADYLHSDGGQKARRRLIAQGDWQTEDGRGSHAMLELVERLRILSRANRGLEVATIKPDTVSASGSQTPYEEEMAANLKAVTKDEHALILALVGNVHASRLPFAATTGFSGFEPMAMHLSSRKTLSVFFITDGGMAWNCQQNCGPHTLGADIGPSQNKLTILKHQSYDVLLPVGKVSASVPASP